MLFLFRKVEMISVSVAIMDWRSTWITLKSVARTSSKSINLPSWENSMSPYNLWGSNITLIPFRSQTRSKLVLGSWDRLRGKTWCSLSSTPGQNILTSGQT